MECAVTKLLQHFRPSLQSPGRTKRCGRLFGEGCRPVLHPSVCLIQSRFPIVTIWEHNQTNDDNGMIERWSAELPW